MVSETRLALGISFSLIPIYATVPQDTTIRLKTQQTKTSSVTEEALQNTLNQITATPRKVGTEGGPSNHCDYFLASPV